MEYVRPQVLEWTNNMSTNITRHKSFLNTRTPLTKPNPQPDDEPNSMAGTLTLRQYYQGCTLTTDWIPSYTQDPPPPDIQ
jgi:hypothetical protein